MCLLLIGFKVHPGFKLIVAANRDEFYDRPSEPADWRGDKKNILAGKDLKAGGTWMGITRSGKFAAITNFREKENQIENAPSRGNIVGSYLEEEISAQQYLQDLENRCKEQAGLFPTYNGFNVILGDVDQLVYYSNRGKGISILKPGLYGLSNNLLDVAWPKVSLGKSKLEEIIKERDFSVEEIFGLLKNDKKAEDHELPDTGVGLEYERILSPLFIKTEKYGTRSSTVVMVDKKNQVFFEERSFIPLAHTKFHFSIQK